MRRAQIECIGLMFMITLGQNVVCAQSLEGSALQVARLQVRSIAAEVVAQMRPLLADSATVGLRVEMQGNATVVENAFVRELAEAQFKPTLSWGEKTELALLRVLVIDRPIRYVPVPSGLYQRHVENVLEARLENSRTGSVVYLGSFQRSSIDTVQERGEIRLYTVGGGPEVSEDPSFFEKIAGPVLIIGATFLIIYLFFTVRN